MQFHWCLSWCFSWMHVVGQRRSCIACIRTHSHQEISPCTLNRLESQWKTFPSLPGLDGLRAGGLLVISWCAGLESRATHSSGVALEASVLSVPHFLLALEFPLEHFQQQLKFLVCPPVHHSVFWPLLISFIPSPSS